MRRQSHQASSSFSLRSTGPSTASPSSAGSEANAPATGSAKAQRRASMLDSFHTTHIGNLSSLGVLGEQEDLGEQVRDLMDKLATKEREYEKLQDQVDLLQSQLKSRPPRSEIEELMREFRMQESLLSGFQRENEKASREIEKGKTRERLLESHLERLFGPTWATSLDIPAHTTAGPVSASSPVDSPIARSALVHQDSPLSRTVAGSSAVHQQLAHTPSSSSSFVPSSSKSIPLDATSQETVNTGDDAQDILAQLHGFKDLMRSLEKRIGQREGELHAVLSRAEEESRLWTSKQALYH